MTSSNLERYLQAATRENTRRTYASATRHFEEEWGGHLPASSDAVARYVADHAAKFSNNTLRQRLAALGRWHAEHGFQDPTRHDLVRRTMRGVRAVHGAREQQAAPLQIEELACVVVALTEQRAQARAAGDVGDERRLTRDLALLLLGFWRAFRGDELVRLEVQYVTQQPGVGMTVHLPSSKGDRENEGTTFPVPALSRLCPVEAMRDWLQISGLTEGPVFRGITLCGQVGESGLHANSLIRLLRQILEQGGMPDASRFSGHSLRRGLAGWANANGWDVKTLMAYVGWRDVNSAMRYIDANDAFSARRLESGIAATLPISSPASAPIPKTCAGSNALRTAHGAHPVPWTHRWSERARRHIEEVCLARYQATCLDEDRSRYAFWLEAAGQDDEWLDECIAEILDELHRIADNHRCALEASICDSTTGRSWD
ncbi:MAG: tyrosine-type recombinase/integrase [Xanthomonadales bacterium]|nr:tyrosine-type recombinase/integrase [Xanthomonadales bacterium]